MTAFYKLIFTLFLSFSCCLLNAQQQPTQPTAKPAALPGSVKGALKDTSRSYLLRSATVSVYRAADSTLLAYQISNNYGEFNITNLPVGIPLKLEVSYIGYQTLRRIFTIDAGKNIADLQTLVMGVQEHLLDEVVVSVPPIRMNGDTLEFNASAFKLDSNAVVEDLLRKIPNITLWGDGQITVNGREVKSVLVNGKPFFGGDAIIATQNIAKNALEKIQVYNTAQNKDNPLDSTLEMNLKLKKGKDIGYFGKIGIGYGSDGRFEADGNLNFYTPKMQLALIGAANNINKSAGSISTLVRNSTYKGTGTKVEYQPDFRTSGISRPKAVGVTFAYNFIEKPTYDNKSALTANYFIQGRNNENVSDRLTTTTINDSTKVFEKSRSENISSGTNQTIDSKYEWVKKNNSLTTTQSLTFSRGQSSGITLRSAENNKQELTSTNNSSNQSNFNNTSFAFSASYRHSQSYLKPKQFIKGLSASYNLFVNDNNNQSQNITEFRSLIKPSDNKDFNRRYNTKFSNVNQQLNVELSNIKSMIFGSKAKLGGVDFGLTNKLSLVTSKNDNDVTDMNTALSKFETNGYLTNRVQTTTVDEVPGLRITKSIGKYLSNRYSKSWYFSFSPQQKFFSQHFSSDRDYQNISRNYSRFVPEASVSYSDYRYGSFSRSYNLNYSTTVTVPTLQQLAPLIDSSNLYSLQGGNLNLRESVERRISLSFNHYDMTGKNTLNYGINLSMSWVENDITDSSFISTDNKRTHYLVNAGGNKVANINGNMRKAFKLKNSELQLGLNTNVNMGKDPSYLNNTFAFSNSFNTSNSFNVNYTYKSYFAVEGQQSYATSFSKQEAFNTEYSNTNLTTAISASYNATKKLTFNSNISYNTNKPSRGASINYTIWNASILYRFLKSNNAEIKLAALDLLRQNTSVINTVGANSFTIGTQNVLQQYFMVTLSYYPRQFGKKAVKN